MSRQLSPKNINFYAVYNEKPAKSAQEKRRTVAIVFPILMCLVLGTAYGLLRYQIYLDTTQIAPVIAYIESDETKELLAKAEEFRIESAALRAESDNLTMAEQALKSYPVLNKISFAVLDSCVEKGIVINNIDFENSLAQVTFSGDAATVTQVADYVERLRKTKLFSALEYSGYWQDTKPLYTFTVTGTLKAVEQK